MTRRPRRDHTPSDTAIGALKQVQDTYLAHTHTHTLYMHAHMRSHTHTQIFCLSALDEVPWPTLRFHVYPAQTDLHKYRNSSARPSVTPQAALPLLFHLFLPLSLSLSWINSTPNQRYKNSPALTGSASTLLTLCLSSTRLMTGLIRNTSGFQGCVN